MVWVKQKSAVSFVQTENRSFTLDCALSINEFLIICRVKQNKKEVIQINMPNKKIKINCTNRPKASSYRHQRLSDKAFPSGYPGKS